MLRIWQFLTNLFRRKPKLKYKEGRDFELVPDIQRAKKNDPYPWNIKFLDRVVKVNYVKFHGLRVEILIDYIKGDEFTLEESVQFGELISELIIAGKQKPIKQEE